MVSPFDAMRKQLEKMYNSRCAIINYTEKVDEYGTTTYTPVIIAKEQPCKLSYNSANNATQTKTVDNVEQTITLIMSPTLDVKEGSDVTVTLYNGTILEFVSSGIPKRYRSHQEISLISKEVYG